MGILKSDIIDRERGMELDLARNEDILDDCSKESRGEMNYANSTTTSTTTTAEKNEPHAFSLNHLFIYTDNADQKDMCTRAYFFIRCVAISNLVYDDAK